MKNELQVRIDSVLKTLARIPLSVDMVGLEHYVNFGGCIGLLRDVFVIVEQLPDDELDDKEGGDKPKPPEEAPKR